MNKPIILIIDDQPWQLHHFLGELKEEFVTVLEETPAKSVELLQSGICIDALVLDIQMPSPRIELNERTNHGLDTGLWFLDQVSDLLVSAKLPVIILSNRLKEHIEERVEALPYPKGQVQVFWKQDTSDQIIRIALRRAILQRESLPGFSVKDYLRNFLGEYPEQLNLLSEHIQSVNDAVTFLRRGRALLSLISSDGERPDHEQAARSFAPYFEIYRLGSIGPRYATLLIEGGKIRKLEELAASDPIDLGWDMLVYNREYPVFDEEWLPPRQQVAHWIKRAAELIISDAHRSDAAHESPKPQE